MRSPGRFPGWPVFPEVPAAFAEAHDRAWKLVALSNSDRDLIDASLETIGVPFEGAIVASEIGSYKRLTAIGERLPNRSALTRPTMSTSPRATSMTSCPPASFGIRSIWINRLGERAEAPPTRELPDLVGLADILDELVPPAA